MHLAVLHLTNGGLSGGFRKYARMVLPRLAADPRVSRLDVFDPPGVSALSWDAARHHSWPEGDWLRGFPGLRARVRELAPDVVFIPTARWIDCDAPTMVMVRNMLPLVAPVQGNSLREAVTNLGRRRAARRAVRRADSVVAVSRFVRDYLVERWGVEAERVRVVYHGLQHGAAARAMVPAALAAEPGPFLFTAGFLLPYRGVEDAVRALARLGERGLTPRLVVAGDVPPTGEHYVARLQALARSLGVEGQLVWAGHLSGAEMEWCFRNCSAFVMTSRVEACPNLVLEALAHGVVSVSTRSAPMPEFYGDAALYYPPGDAAALADRLAEALALEPGPRRALRAAARRRARDFSWNATAEQTLAALLELGGRPAGAAAPASSEA